MTAQQPENNVVRTTIQALSAVLGGTQSLHTNSRDEALWLPTEQSVRLALRTQQVIAYESGVADSVDPLAGSYLIEHLTDEIDKAASEYISKIESMGGALSAIERGYMQNEIQDAAYAAQRSIESGEQIVVGVNQFQAEEKVVVDRLRVDPGIEAAARKRLAELREQRNPSKTAELLNQVDSAARGTQNLVPLFIECVEHDLTLGEICNILRAVWGEYVAPQFA